MNSMTFLQLIQKYEVIIPVIQRDYAQGRNDVHSVRVRRDFAADLKKALTENTPLMLDFIYGEVEGGMFLPFDGQQRLTTLFLLHWYAAAREETIDPRQDNLDALLTRFRYEVRESSHAFCRELAEHIDILRQNVSGSEKPSSLITDECWFSPCWLYDSTVTGMLTMLDSIHAGFCNVAGLRARLTAQDCPVRFRFARLSSLGNNADDIFITMNARGKPLTPWEHFKAQFLPWLKATYRDRADAIARKLDNDWLDAFWSGFPVGNDEENPAEATDDRLARFFSFAARVLLALPGPELKKTKGDLFSLVSAALSPDRQQLCPACDNLDLLVRMLDGLHERILPEGKSSASLFADLFIKGSDDTLPVPGKISLFSGALDDKADLLRLCCGKYGDMMTWKERLMLFGCLMAIALNVPADKAGRRLRILRNLLEHPPYGHVRNPGRQLLDVHALIADGTIADDSQFNAWQIREEKAKDALRNAHEGDAELQAALDYLEDHPLMCGRVAVFSRAGQEDCEPPVFERESVVKGAHFLRLAFEGRRIFYDTLLRSLLSFGEYEPPRRTFCLEHDGPLSNLRTFLCPAPDAPEEREHFLRLRHGMERLAQESQNADTTEELESALSLAADRWLDERQKRRELPWRWYFAGYAAMRPDFRADGLPESRQGYYTGLGGVSRFKTFEWVQLEKKTCGGRHWNPFLRTVFVLAKREGVKTLTWDADSRPCRILLPGGLSLTMNECAWILSPDDETKASVKARRATLERLRALHPGIDEEGYLPVPGMDSENGVDYRHIQGHQSRNCDSTDRIALILPVLKTLDALA